MPKAKNGRLRAQRERDQLQRQQLPVINASVDPVAAAAIERTRASIRDRRWTTDADLDEFDRMTPPAYRAGHR